MEIDNFKSFIRTIPSIKEDVLNGRYTWQQLYEFYVLYGEDDKMWEPYKKSQIDLSGILEIVKNVDLDALAKSMDGIQKILDLVGGFIVKDDQKPQSRQWYDDLSEFTNIYANASKVVSYSFKISYGISNNVRAI